MADLTITATNVLDKRLPAREEILAALGFEWEGRPKWDGRTIAYAEIGVDMAAEDFKPVQPDVTVSPASDEGERMLEFFKSSP